MTAAIVITASLVAAATFVLTAPRREVGARSRALLEARLQAPTRSSLPLATRPQRVLSFVEALTAEAQAGRPSAAAVAEAARPLLGDPIFQQVAATVDLGGDPVDALVVASRQPKAEALWAVVVTLRAAATSGAAMSTALRTVASGVREDLELQREIDGQLAAPRATARLLVGLPVLVWLMGTALGAEPLRVLLTTPYGLGCLVVGAALEAAGLHWVDRMAAAAAR